MNLYFFMDILTQSPNIISKASTLLSTKVVSQEDSKFANPILQGVKKLFFITSNTIILRSIQLSFLKLFSQTTLVI
jgi:hypothetical protein